MAELPDEVDRVCGTCRSALPDGGACPRDERARVYRLGWRAHREELRELSWAVVPRLAWLGTNYRLVLPCAGAGVSGLATFFFVWSLGDPGVAVFASGFGALVGLVVLAAIALAFDPPTSFYKRQPTGAYRPCGVPDDPNGPVGTIERANAEQSADAALACFLELSARQGVVATFRVGVIDPLVIVLEDGRRVHVPAGRAVLTGEPSRVTPLDAAAAEARARALGLTPDAAHGESDEGPVPTDGGFELTLREGDRVRVGSDLRVAPREAHGGAFRSAANRDLAPVGVVRLHAL